MYNRATRELADQTAAWEQRERGNCLTRNQMLRKQASRVKSEAAKTEAFHGRVENWLTGEAARAEQGVRPPSPSYQTKNHAAHHRFRDRDPSKELGPMRMSAAHYTAPGGLYNTTGSYSQTARIEMNRSQVLENMALFQEAYQQVNELPSHSKYSMRNRAKSKEMHNPLRFGDASETQRIHNATLRDQMLETRGQYDHSLHASKFSAPHSPRQASNTAPRYREYSPTKWMGKPLALTSTGTLGSHTQKIGDNTTMPHDFVDMQLAHHKKQYGDTAWAAYQGRIGSLARQRKPNEETDQDRMFHTNVAAGEFVTGPDHRKWATLPPNFATNPAFMTDHRRQLATAGHYAHAYLGSGADGLPSINSSFGKVQGRMGAAQAVIASRRKDIRIVAP